MLLLSNVNRTTVYIDQMSTWYDYKTKEEVVNNRLAYQLQVFY